MGDYIVKGIEATAREAIAFVHQIQKRIMLTKHRVGRNNYYINEPLIQLIVRQEG